MTVDHDDTTSATTIRRLIGVYNADGSLRRGELAYWIAARLGRAHCALCDITHGVARGRPDWKRGRARVPVPFDTYHRDDQPDPVRAATGGRTPIVVAETDREVVVLLEADGLDACAGSVDLLIDRIEAAARRSGLAWPAS